MKNTKEEAVNALREIIYTPDTDEKSCLLAMGINSKDNLDQIISMIKGNPKLLITILLKSMLESDQCATIVQVTSRLYDVAKETSLLKKFNKASFDDLLRIVNTSLNMMDLFSAMKQDLGSEVIPMTDDVRDPFAQA